MANRTEYEPRLAILGVDPGDERSKKLVSYLAEGGYQAGSVSIEELAANRPSGIVLDISPFSDDGWGKLLELKNNRALRNIPVLPLFLSETGEVGGVFPAAGFFVMPGDEQFILERLAVLGLTEEAETWDLQVMIAGDNIASSVINALESAGFDVVRAYNGKEALALASIHPCYFFVSTLELQDMIAFELFEKLKLYPYNRNAPMFVLMNSEMSERVKKELSCDVASLVSKRHLSATEVISFLKRKNQADIT